ncbi:Predicted dehydrogenase [Cnuella takakiae]|uniref:Predicted dehydrogenase n=1 Tax=Cnuella takakiae TaxID=1302690 RepID=A0A1M5DV37_9BACT|nr:Gfo/Idh/MocA family oxidoreductase [Cnuella takakiae]OLY93859.1 hypothetical protein BUE76_19730 [Cnuella takakiae]SHF70701.1 Predicted dehydrogenase [Cnuella takakiae]
MDTVRWAILGAGKIAHKFAQDIQQVPNARLVAVAARDKERARVFASQYQAPIACTYQELYAHPEVDAVYIATTHNFHLEQSLACIEAGKAVLCEKPITINHHQLGQLTAAARQRGVLLMEALWTWLLPAMQQAKAWVKEGRIGAIQTIHADFCYLMPYEPEGRLYNPQLAGGALLDLGIYPVAFTTYFMGGSPDTIRATAIMTDTGVDASTSMIFQYGAVPAFLYCSLAGRSKVQAVIMGENGHIVVPDFFKASKAFLYNAEGKETDRFDDGRSTLGYNYEIEEASRCFLEGRTESSQVPLDSSLAIQEILTTVRTQIGLKYPFE